MTYLGAAGRPVIDYVVTNKSGEELIKCMDIVDNTTSDHMAIKIILNIETNEMEKEKEKKKKEKEITIWSEETIREYKGKPKKPGTA